MARLYYKKRGKHKPQEDELLNEIDDVLSSSDGNTIEEFKKLSPATNYDELKLLHKKLYEIKNQSMNTDTLHEISPSEKVSSVEGEQPAVSSAPEQQEQTKAAPSPATPASPLSDEHDPLVKANTKARAYATPGANASVQDIPEPSFNTNTQGTPPPFSEPGQGGGGVGGASPTQEPFMNTADLPPNEKEKSAKELAKFIVNLYGDNIPALFKWMTKVSDKKVVGLERSGEVNFNLPLSDGNGNILTVRDHIGQTNANIDAAFVVPEQWRQEIMPYIIAELKRKGLGLTPIQVIMFMVGMDLATKGIMAYQIHSQMKDFLDYMKEETRKRPNSPPPVSHVAPPYTPPSEPQSQNGASEPVQQQEQPQASTTTPDDLSGSPGQGEESRDSDEAVILSETRNIDPYNPVGDGATRPEAVVAEEDEQPID